MFVKCFSIVVLSVILIASIASAQSAEIEVPKGWSATEDGIVKGDNRLTVGPVLDLGGLSPAAYLDKRKSLVSDEATLVQVKEIKDGELVIQVMRELTQGDKKIRSTLFICKKGRNKHRLLELLTYDVFSVISGGKAAISFCSQ